MAEDGRSPTPIRIFEPAPLTMDDGGDAGAPAVRPELAAAARRVLARDGRDLVLQPWQVAYLVRTSEGREGFVPPGCGVGKGWLQARLDEELDRGE